jgi:GT2 family glycosyltransferase
MKITIGIPTYAGASRVDSLLASIAMRTPLLSRTGTEVTVVLVDDGSPKEAETAAVARRWSGLLPLRYVVHSANRGISAGWNTAARAVDSDLVVLCNDDVIAPSGGWLEALVHPLVHSPGVGVVGLSWHAFTLEDVAGLLAGPTSDRLVTPRDPTSKAPVADRRPLYEDTWPARVMCPTGELFAFRRSDYDAIGGFDEAYKSFYEESCFSTSMAARGRIGLQLTYPFCFHMWSATFGASPELKAAERMAASRLHYRAKWGVPEGVHEFECTNPKFLGAIGDVEVEFLRRGGEVWKGTLKRDGAFVGGQPA